MYILNPCHSIPILSNCSIAWMLIILFSELARIYILSKACSVPISPNTHKHFTILLSLLLYLRYSRSVEISLYKQLILIKMHSFFDRSVLPPVIHSLRQSTYNFIIRQIPRSNCQMNMQACPPVSLLRKNIHKKLHIIKYSLF